VKIGGYAGGLLYKNLYFLVIYGSLLNMTLIKKTNTIIKKKVVLSTLNIKDTGSPEAQVFNLSNRINKLALHLKKNNKDNHSRTGLLQMVANRRTHLNYLKHKNKTKYDTLVKKIGLK